MEIEYDNFLKLDNRKIIDLTKDVSFDKLILYPKKYLNNDTNYLLICERGIKSKKTAEILRRLGYKVYSLKGGRKKIMVDKMKDN